ncbi:MAG: TadE family type IV pilus minor pilin [Ornithinimicrobium sp.]
MARERRDAGMATAELAMVIPAVLLVLAMCLTGLSLGADQIRCVDAARAAARAASRGEPTADVRRLAQALAPSGSQVQVDLDAGRGEVSVTVRAPRHTRLLASLPAPSATASAPLEPVVGSDP